VDLDTKDPVWYSATDGSKWRVEQGRGKCLPSFSPVVWARTAVERKDTQDDESPIQLYQLLGGCQTCQGALSGVARFPRDADGVVRRYVNKFNIDGESDPVPSFAAAIADKYRGYPLNDARRPSWFVRGLKCFTHLMQSAWGLTRQRKSAPIFNFARDRESFLTINANPLLHSYLENGGKTRCEGTLRVPVNPEDQNYETYPTWSAAACGKIVLIGGKFEDSGDSHPTSKPDGLLQSAKPIFGVELNAYAIDSELHGKPIFKVSRWLQTLLDVLAGTFFVYCFWCLKHRPDISFVWFGAAVTLCLALLISSAAPLLIRILFVLGATAGFVFHFRPLKNRPAILLFARAASLVALIVFLGRAPKDPRSWALAAIVSGLLVFTFWRLRIRPDRIFILFAIGTAVCFYFLVRNGTPLNVLILLVIVVGVFVYTVLRVRVRSSTLFFILGTAGTVCLAFFVSLLLLLCRRWSGTIPVLIGVTLHQYYEHFIMIREHSKTRKI
jgi:hypothetical protein